MAFVHGGLVLGLVLMPALAFPQSLGEVAKKEQERREKVRKSGVSTRTLTEADLANTKGAVVNPSAAAEGESGASTATPAEPAAATGETTPAADEPPQDTPEDHWRRRVAHARARVTTAQQRHDAMQQIVRLGQPLLVDENGRKVIYSTQQLKAKADAAQAALTAAQTALDNLLEEARRKGALPGWLR